MWRSQNTLLNSITRPVGDEGHHESMASRLPYSANLGYYKYWFMADGDTIKAVLDNEDDEREVVLNRARLYHDRRDFYIQYGDTGMRDDYPGPPWWMKRDEARSTSDDNYGTAD